MGDRDRRVAAHIAGACLTREGCPLLWLLPARLALLNLSTEGPVERWIIGPALGVIALVLIWHLTNTP